MGLGDSVKSFYLSLEDKYYSGLDWLDSKGVPVYGVVDAIESANIPSFPIFALLVLVILAGIGFVLIGGFSPAESNVSLSIVDEESNPVAAATVAAKIRDSTADPNSLISNVEGVVTFKVPFGTIVDVTVTKDGFAEAKESVSPNTAEFSKTIVLSESQSTDTRVIRIVNAADNSVYTAPISLRFSCIGNSSFSKEVTSQNGQVTVDGIPKNCGLLVAAVSTSGLSVGSGQIDLAAPSPVITVSEEQLITGTVKVVVAGETQKALSNINVRLLKQNGQSLGSQSTGETGIVSFEKVPIGKYFVRATDLGSPARFAEFDSSVKGTIKDVLENQSTEFAVTMEEKVLGKIKLLVRDSESLQPVSNVSVTLYKDKTELDVKSTGSDGKVEFSVGDTAPVYGLKLDHQSYLIATKASVGASDSVQEVLLEKLTSENGNSTEVSVVDQTNQPVENVKVVLKKLDGTIASEVLVTGSTGKARFSRLVPDTYYAFVSKEGIGENNSDSVAVTDRQLSKILVALEIGSGDFEVTVLDAGLQPLSGATVKAIDLYSQAVLATQSSQSDGKAKFSIRTDKRVFFEVTAPGFASFYTVSLSPQNGATRFVVSQLVADIAKLEVRWLGLAVGEEQVAEDSSTPPLKAGEKYTARLLLLIPKDTQLDEAGVHVRTGKSDVEAVNVLESDYLFISRINSAATGMIRGTTFSPPTGYAEDSTHLTTGDSKWANMVFSRPKGGAYQIEAEIVVRDNTPLGTTLEINYRGWGKTGSYVRFPTDRVLGENESAQGKQALYAVTNTKLYSVGPSSLCSGSFCTVISIQDLSQDLQTGVFDSFPAKPLTDYKLFFTIINNGSAAFGNAQVEVSTQTGGLVFDEYQITDSAGQRASGNASGAGSFSVPVNDFTQSSTIFGNVVFSTASEGITRLLITVKSSSSGVFQKAIDLEVEPLRDMNIDVLPKNIVSFLNNDLLVRATDRNSESGIPNLSIEIFQTDFRIASGVTDGSGVFRKTLQAPSPGSVFVLKAKKPGYKTVEQQLKVSPSILDVVPSSIEETLTTVGLFSLQKELIITNRTALDLTIREIRFNNDFNRLVRGRLSQNYAGQKLSQGIDSNVFVIIELTDDGKRLLQRQDVHGTLTIYVSDAENTATWANEIPVTVHIGFGGEVLEPKCLIISPDKTEVFSFGNAVTTQVLVANKCRADASFVPLQNLEAKVSWKGTGNEIGLFGLASTGETSASEESASFAGLSPSNGAYLSGVARFDAGATLSKIYRTTLEALNPNTENAFDLTFAPKPGIAGGSGIAVITFRAHHPANNGEELLSGSIEVPVNVNDLLRCIEIDRTQRLTVQSTPPGIGYGIYDQFGYGGSTNQGFGRFDYQGAQNYYGGYNNGTLGTGVYGGYGPGNVTVPPVGGASNANPTLVDYPERVQAFNYPYAGYSEPFYDTLSPYQGTSFGMPFNYSNAWRGQTNFFTVRNNCSIPVQIQLSPDPELLVDNAKFSLSPGNDQRVEIQSSNYYGSYRINVAGKAETGTDLPRKIASLNVDVMPADDPSRYRDCIKLSTTRFMFNDLVQRPVTAKVFNSCFGQGVRLDYDSVTFSNQAYGEIQAQSEGVNGLIQGVQVIDLSTRRMSGNQAQQVLEFEIYKNLSYRTQPGFPYQQAPQDDLYGLRIMATQAYNRVQSPGSLVVRYMTPEGMTQQKAFRVTLEDQWNLLNMLPMFSLGNPYIHPQQCLVEKALDFGSCLTDSDFAGKNTYSYSARRVLNVGGSQGGTGTGYGGVGSMYPYSPYANPAMVGNPSYGYNPYGTSPIGGYSGAQDPYLGNTFQPSNAPNALVQPYPYYNPSPTVSGYPNGQFGGQANMCGSVDSLILSGKEQGSVITKDGLRVTVAVATEGGVGGANAVRVTVDRSNVKAGRIEVNETLRAQVRRQTPLGTYDISLPLRVCVEFKQGGTGTGTPTPGGGAILGPDGIVPGSTPPVACDEASQQTGPGAFDKARFYMLKLDWKYDSIAAEQCNYVSGQKSDKQNNFCDGVQHLAALTKKVKAIRETVSANEAKFNSEETMKKVYGITEDTKLSEYKISSRLPQWMIEHVIINQDVVFNAGKFQWVSDKTKTKPMAYMVSKKSDELLVKGAVSSEMFTRVKALNEVTNKTPNPETFGVIVSKMSEALTGLAALPADSDKIVLLFEKKPELDGLLPKLGADLVSIKDTQFYALTLNEYGLFHQQLAAVLDLDKKQSADIQIGDTTVNVTNAAMQSMLANIKVLSAVEEGEGSEYTYFAYKNGKLRKELEGSKIDLEKFFETFVLAQTLLIKDNYSQQLKDNFQSAYQGAFGSEKDTDYLNVKNWEFESPQLSQSGVYMTMIEYNWADSQKPLKIGITKDTSAVPQDVADAVANNPLFSMPFDVLTVPGTDFGTGTSEQFLIAAQTRSNVTGQTMVASQVKKLGDAKLHSGVLFELNQNNLVFAPSVAYAFSQTQAGETGLLYEVKMGGNSAPAIRWSSGEGGLGTPKSICRITGDNQYYLVKGQSTAGTLFLPAEATPASVRLICTQNTASLSGKKFEFKNGIVAPSALTGVSTTKDSKANNAMDLGLSSASAVSLYDMVQGIRSGYVCISSSGGSMTMHWNAKQIK